MAAKALIAMWDAFRMNRRLTYDLVGALEPEELVRRWERPGLDSVSKHVQEMVAVQHAFQDALVRGAIDFSSVPDVDSFADIDSNQKLISMLEEADDCFAVVLDGDVQRSVRWDDAEIPAEAHMSNLVSHEVFHQGQIALACYVYGLPLPSSWQSNWALPKAEA